MKKGIFWIKIVAIAAVFIFTAPYYAHPVVVDKIVGVVNGEVITQREVMQSLFPLYEEYKKEYTGKKLEEKMVEAEDMVLNQLIEDKLILAEDMVLNQLIEDKLVLSEAKKEGIKADDAEVEARLNGMIKERFGSEANFREILTIQNISLSDMKEALRNDIIKSKIVRQKVGGRIVITPSEVRLYYDAHLNEFVEPERAEVFNILVRKKDQKDEKAKELIKKIKTLLDKGEDFEVMAREYSEGPNAKGGGGLGLIQNGEMMKEIDETIFALAPGNISDIVETPIGYHIFKVTQILPATSKDFDSAKNDITEEIYRKKIDKNLAKWIKELKENAYISIK